MATKIGIYQLPDVAEALTHEPPDEPLSELVDLRHKGPPLEQTQVLDQEQVTKLRAEYEALRAPIVPEPRDGELTDRTVRALGLTPVRPMRKLIGVLLAVLVGMLSWSLCRAWMTGRKVARAATQVVASAARAPVSAPLPARPSPSQPHAANLPRAALDALAAGDRELAHRLYGELARHEAEPGPYSAAAEILARELTAAE